MKLVSLRDDVISLAMQALLSSQETRDDYRELLELMALTWYNWWHLRDIQIMDMVQCTEPGGWPSSCTVWKSGCLNSN